jgi:hypothetical protein
VCGELLIFDTNQQFATYSFDELMTQIQRHDRELASTLGSPTGLPF